MSKQSRLFTIALGCTAFVFVHAAQAQTAPGTPVPPQTGALNLFEPAIHSPESITKDISVTFPGGVCDGYLVMGKEYPLPDGGGGFHPDHACAAPGPAVAPFDIPLSDAESAGCGAPTWSDVIVFHNGSSLPSGVCDASVHFITIISRPDPLVTQATFANADFAASGCLMKSTSADLTTSPVDGNCAGLLLSPFSTVPAFLQGLTVATVDGDARSRWQKEVLIGPNDRVVYQPGPGRYTIFSDLPAMPPWGFAMLGSALLGMAVILIGRRRERLGT
jgi:hypothetical protein